MGESAANAHLQLWSFSLMLRTNPNIPEALCVPLQLVVGLEECLYMWDGETGDVQKLQEYEHPLHITSLKCTDSATHIAVGMSDNTIQLHDIAANKLLRIMRGHTGSVYGLSWNKHTLTSGSNSGKIMNSDVRVKHHAVGWLEAHDKCVCGLSWSPNLSQLASGGADGLLAVWDARCDALFVPVHLQCEHSNANRSWTTAMHPLTDAYAHFLHPVGWSSSALGACATPIPVSSLEKATERFMFCRKQTEPALQLTEHTSTVKAVAWCPFKSKVLASGGGTHDHHIRIWDTSSGSQLNSLDTGRPVRLSGW
jgi:WD40 repeat protein